MFFLGFNWNITIVGYFGSFLGLVGCHLIHSVNVGVSKDKGVDDSRRISSLSDISQLVHVMKKNY